MESDLWALGTNKKIRSRESRTSSFCATERNKTNSAQVSDIFSIFVFPSPFVTLVAMKPKMLQNKIEEGKTRDFSVLLKGQKENKGQRGKVLTLENSKFQF